MKFSEDYGNARYPITGYGDDYVQVNQTRHERSLIITLDELIPDWGPAVPSDLMQEEVLQALIEHHPEIVLLGTGRRIHFPPPQIMALFANHHIGLEVLDSAAACRTFNILLSEGRNVAAALLMPNVEEQARHVPDA
jgi:uncharacterized protein